MGVFTVTCLEKDGSAGGIFFLGLNNSYAYCNPHYALPTFMFCCYFFNIFWKIRENLGRVGRITLLNITIFALFRILEECYLAPGFQHLPKNLANVNELQNHV